MPKWLRKALPVAIALLVLLYLFTVDNPSSQLFDTADSGQTQTAPVFFITDFESRQYGDSGTIVQILRGLRADHFQPKGQASAEDYTVIEQLEAEIFQDQEDPWLIRANQGVANQKGQQITLSGNVKLWLQDPERGLTELTTEKLVYFPKRRFATTDAPVRITTPDGTADAIGLDADLTKQILTLKKRVRSVHAPY
ncbi:LPS export ABC transporter periplasmic protein LptC [Simiduia agarivorans]|uniref:Lipopolysaccharide export system protein LptC n=1 Tax=Simiduia agarivorans (strain DSM 21679 / JCM 13881 / BCRC 17597 / SA1) TaxID=1117647 RepID=K4L385_SIMAS|nr:LPS export ABC transporter periplasmic protein LptC [Simiduia agarivorans]AFV00643.1 hypothetical protein M5M_17570 [Simiduia agarivorans SA1 = DSM 21679]